MIETPFDCLMTAKSRHDFIAAFGGNHASQINAAEMLQTYCEACFEDLRLLWIGLKTTLRGVDSHARVEISIDPSLEVNAYVTKTDRSIRFYLTLGLFIACDDFSGIILPYYDHELGPLNASLSRTIRDADGEWSRRFVNYEHLLRSGAGVEFFAPFLGPHSVPRFTPVRLLIANSILTWCLAHEIGHWIAGHVDHHVLNSGDVRYEEFPSDAGSANSSITSTSSIYFAREFEADSFATFELAYILLRKQNTETLSRITGGNIGKIGFLSLVKGIASYAPLLFQKAAQPTFTAHTHPHCLARAYGVWATFESIHHGLLERFKDVDVFEHYSAEQAIEVWCSVIPHVYYISNFLGFGVSTEANDIRESVQLAWNASISNEHKLLEASKVILSLWHSKFLLNYFTPQERFHEYVEQWATHWRALGAGLAEEFGRHAPHFQPHTPCDLTARFTKEVTRIVWHESQVEIHDVEKARKIFADTVLVAAYVGSHAATSTRA